MRILLSLAIAVALSVAIPAVLVTRASHAEEPPPSPPSEPGMWFESFENGSSEILSIAVLVLLSIVAASHAATGAT